MSHGNLPRKHGILAVLGLLLPFTFFIFWTKSGEDRIFDGNFHILKVRRDVSINEAVPAPIAALNIHFIALTSNDEHILQIDQPSLVSNILYTNIMRAFHGSQLPISFDERIIQDPEWNKYFTMRNNQSYINEDLLTEKLYDMFQVTRKYQSIVSSCIECTDMYFYLYSSTNQVFIETDGAANISNGFINHKYNSAVLFLPGSINQGNAGDITRVVGNQFRALLNLNDQNKLDEHTQIISRDELVTLEKLWTNSMFMYCIQTCISYEQVFPTRKKEFVAKWNSMITILNSFHDDFLSASFAQVRSVYVSLLDLQHSKLLKPSYLPWDQELAVLAPFWIPIFVPIAKGFYTLYRK